MASNAIHTYERGKEFHCRRGPYKNERDIMQHARHSGVSRCRARSRDRIAPYKLQARVRMRQRCSANHEQAEAEKQGGQMPPLTTHGIRFSHSASLRITPFGKCLQFIKVTRQAVIGVRDELRDNLTELATRGIGVAESNGRLSLIGAEPASSSASCSGRSRSPLRCSP